MKIFVLTYLVVKPRFRETVHPTVELFSTEELAVLRLVEIMEEHGEVLSNSWCTPPETEHRANSANTRFVRYEPIQVDTKLDPDQVPLWARCEEVDPEILDAANNHGQPVQIKVIRTTLLIGPEFGVKLGRVFDVLDIQFYPNGDVRGYWIMGDNEQRVRVHAAEAEVV